ncbi:transducin/WD40 repeat-like superfamily protein [Actinidia rufa]|uniref:Transducin/WD40 repeat-like superfamily protein n=1 Tax=Actinidia rufa TaxID=165716 RepID=A0A7J0HDJ0_9ERIC|nr:transducin/WD40 repeat-like superfamily protein [Actinidia rufa]
MKLRSWLSTCSSATSISTADDATSLPPQTTRNLLFSDTSSASPSSQDTSSSSSLQSNLSLQTLPSVPSLQKLFPYQTLTLSLSSLSHHHLLASLKPRPLQVTSLALHHNLLYAASGTEINVFDVNSYALVDTFNGKDSSSGSVKSFTFCNGKVLTAHQDCKIRVWKSTETKRHKLVATLPTVTDYFRRFIFPKNHFQIRRHRKRLWIEHHDTVSGLAIANNLIYSVSWDKYLKIWSVPNFRCLQSIKAHDDAINAVVASIDGTIYTASADPTLEKHKSAVNALAVNDDGTTLFSGACDRSILVWEREDSANYMVVTGALRGHSKAILCLINVSDLLLSGSADRTVRIWRRGSDGRFCCLTVTDAHEKAGEGIDGRDGGWVPRWWCR